jgi:hypothetical protein
MVVEEQGKTSEKRRMSSILWDTFTGSAPYTDILKRGLNPMVSTNLVLNTFKRSSNGKIKTK